MCSIMYKGNPRVRLRAASATEAAREEVPAADPLFRAPHSVRLARVCHRESSKRLSLIRYYSISCYMHK